MDFLHTLGKQNIKARSLKLYCITNDISEENHGEVQLTDLEESAFV